MKFAKVIIFIMFSLVVATSGCTAQEDLFINASVHEEAYSDPLGISAQTEFVITLEVKNQTNEKMIFKKIVGNFKPQGGEPLAIEMLGEKNLIFLPGERKKLEFQTNGYTNDLIKDSLGKPINFLVEFYLPEKVTSFSFDLNLNTATPRIDGIV